MQVSNILINVENVIYSDYDHIDLCLLNVIDNSYIRVKT